MNEQKHAIDSNALKFNQINIITLVLAGFIFDLPSLAAGVSAVLIAGSMYPGLALFTILYRRVVLRLKLMSPHFIDDHPAPHQFARLLGGIMLGVGAVFLYAGFPITGWVLSWVVVLLAAANLSFGFCAGCFVYYQLGRVGLPGFRPREGTGA